LTHLRAKYPRAKPKKSEKERGRSKGKNRKKDQWVTIPTRPTRKKRFYNKTGVLKKKKKRNKKEKGEKEMRYNWGANAEANEKG